MTPGSPFVTLLFLKVSAVLLGSRNNRACSRGPIAGCEQQRASSLQTTERRKIVPPNHLANANNEGACAIEGLFASRKIVADFFFLKLFFNQQRTQTAFA